MFDYEANRIDGGKEQMANNTVQLTMSILQVALQRLDHPGEKACLLGGVAAVPLSGLAVLLGVYEEGEKISPKPDDVIFGACYMISCIEEHPNGMIAGFSAGIIEKAEILFQQLMGREYPINEHVKCAIAQSHAEAASETPDHLKPFLPH
jgi:hypothetical protein